MAYKLIFNDDKTNEDMNEFIESLYNYKKPEENEVLSISISANIFNKFVFGDYFKQIDEKYEIFKYKDYDNIIIIKNESTNNTIDHNIIEKNRPLYQYSFYISKMNNEPCTNFPRILGSRRISR